MNSTRNLFLISVLIAVVSLVLAFGTELRWPEAIAAIGVGFFVWFGQYKQKWPWSAHLILIGTVVLTIIGVFLRVKLYFLLPAFLAAIAAWDLARFQQRMYDAQVSETIRKMENRHLGLLVLALGIGGILAGIVLTIQRQLGFGIMLVLGVTLVISFGQIYRILTTK